jgi:hypothetical protein
MGFTRISLYDGDRIQNIREPGAYLLFEERRGASEPALPPPIAITVTSKQGDVVPVDLLVKPGSRVTPFPYRTPWQEGRALASFRIEEPGEYHVHALPIRPTSGYAYRPGGTLAIGRESATTWLGSWLGLLVLAGVPLAGGVVVLAVGRRRRHARAVDAKASTSLDAHGRPPSNDRRAVGPAR